MMTTLNIHGCKDVRISRYHHGVNGLIFDFIGEGIGDGEERHQTTAYGIKPDAAIKIMSILGTPETYIFYNDRSLSLDEYIEELAVQEVLGKMGESNAT